MINRRKFLKTLGVTVIGGAVVASFPSMGYSHDSVFVLDVSGGMPERVFQLILKEASKENGLLITFDTQIVEVFDLKDVNQDTQLRSGGGTCIGCVDEYFSKQNLNPRKTVVFTDGYIFDGWGNLPSNTNWVIVDIGILPDEDSKSKIVAPYGTTTYLDLS